MGCKDTQNYYLRASNYSLIKVHRYYETEIFYYFYLAASPFCWFTSGKRKMLRNLLILNNLHFAYFFLRRNWLQGVLWLRVREVDIHIWHSNTKL